MYKRILVPLDGSNFSEQVLPYAQVIAEAYHAQVELLRIADPDARPPFWPSHQDDQYLEEIAAKQFRASVPVTTATEIGKPAQVIVDHAKGDPACLIAMATHGLSGPRRWLIGSVASKVIQTAPNPLLLIRPVENADSGRPIRLDTIFVPLDGSGLAERVLPHVRTLAKALKLEIHFVRVYMLPADAYLVADGVIAPGPAVYRDELKDEAETYLEGKVAGLQAERFDRVLATAIQGDAAGEIIDLAIRTPNNLIAMSTHGRSGIGRWVLGSVAERVIQHSRDPVLLIRAG
jgi:nucleotide-binding universal stress UspA family protein